MQTATVEPAAQDSPTATTAPEPKAVVFDAGSFRVLSLHGDTIATYLASGLQYVNPGQAQAVGDAVYYRRRSTRTSSSSSRRWGYRTWRSPPVRTSWRSSSRPTGPGSRGPRPSGGKERLKVSCTWRPSMVPAPKWWRSSRPMAAWTRTTSYNRIASCRTATCCMPGRSAALAATSCSSATAACIDTQAQPDSRPWL